MGSEPGNLGLVPPDYSYRRYAAADAVLRLVQRDRPEAMQQLRSRVRAVIGLDEDDAFDAATLDAVTTWCDELRLRCEDIEFAALCLALSTDNDDWLLGGGPALGYEDPDHPDGDPCYRIPWIPGESKRKFVARALTYRKKKQEGESGRVFASDRINPKHVEWFVRFQVHEEGFDRIADGKGRRDVKRAVRDLASLLQLKLRPTKPGRPKGRGGPQRLTLLIRELERRTRS